MPLPKGFWATKDHSQVMLDMNPAIYLKYKPNKDFRQQYDWTKASYRITPRNFFKVLKFFNHTVKWLFGDKYKDLFLVNDENQLIFNADYKNLHVTTPRSEYEAQVLQAIPTVVEIKQKLYEGIHLYVNQSIYCIPLTFEEVAEIFEILRGFQFSTEIAKLLLAYQYTISHNSVTEKESIFNKTPFD